MKMAWMAGVVAVALAAGLVVWQSSRADSAADAPSTVPVTRGDVELTVLASGVIEANSLVSVGSRVSGQVETLAVSLGQRVEKGDLIAQIDSLSQNNAVLQAEADLAQLEADIIAKQASIRESELAFQRARTLNARNLSSTETLEAAEAALAVAKAGLTSLEAQKSRAEVTISSARLELERTQITAPISGTIVAVVTSEGQTVNASSDAPVIVKIAVLDSMVVKADISEADVVRVAPGQTASFTLLGEPDLAFDATVRDIEPAPASIKDSDEVSTEEAIYYKGLFDVANPEGKLRIGMTAQVTISIDRADDVLTLLSSALGRQQADGSYAVQVYDPARNATESRTVKVGLNNNITAEILDGLEEGDRVVTATAAAPASAGSRRPRGLGF